MDSTPEILARAFYIEDLQLRFHLLLGKIAIQEVWNCNDGQIGLSRRRCGRERGGNMSCPAQETFLGFSNPETALRSSSLKRYLSPFLACLLFSLFFHFSLLPRFFACPLCNNYACLTHFRAVCVCAPEASAQLSQQ